MRRFAWAAILALALPAAAVHAQEPPLDDGLEALLSEALPAGMGGDVAAYQGLMALWQGRNVRAREEAEAVLARDPDAVEGHALLGLVFHQAEGDLARALHHADLALALFDERHPEGPGPETPWFWHAAALELRERVLGEMGRDADRLGTLDLLQETYAVSPADRAWPLMRMGRYAEAQRWAELALQMEDRRGSHDTARTSLCAIAAERWDREAAWRRCTEAEQMQTTRRAAVASSNAAEAALEVFRFDDAERHALDATRLSTDTPSSPWSFLIQLYLAEGRFAEAGSALPRMLAWIAAQPPQMRHQNEIYNALNAASLLLVTGRVERAARLSGRASLSPDRHGLSNESVSSRMAAIALVDHMAQRTAEARAWEDLAGSLGWATAGDALALVPRIVRHRAAAWVAARRAATWLANDRVLEATLRPYLADMVPLAEWQQLEVARVVGPGVVEASLERARRAEPSAPASAYLDAMAAQAAQVRGDAAVARGAAEAALAALPAAEVLMRARLQTTVAWAASEQGDDGRANAAWEAAWQLDPGVVRRAGGTLPVRIEVSGDALPAAVAARLRRSPRFADRGHGFRLRIDGPGDGVRACLFSPSGAMLACGRAAPEEGEAIARTAQRAARALHDAAFAPRVDLAQRDLQSLDGSPTASGRASASVVGELDLLAPAAPPDGDEAP